MRQDFLYRGLLKKPALRFSFASTAETVQKAVLTHNCDPVSSLILGRAVTATALLAPMLEKSERYSIRWDYAGKIGSVLCDTDAAGHLRGLIKNPYLASDCASEDEIYGESGFISVIKSDSGKILNSGKAAAGLLEIASDLAFFLSVSDQIETQIAAALKFNSDPQNPLKSSSGFMIQEMPGCDMDAFSVIRERMEKDEFQTLLLDESSDMSEASLYKILRYLLEGAENPEPSWVLSAPPSYFCGCSREKMRQAVLLLDKAELDEIFNSGKNPEVGCQFCKSKYSFNRDELNQ